MNKLKFIDHADKKFTIGIEYENGIMERVMTFKDLLFMLPNLDFKGIAYAREYCTRTNGWISVDNPPEKSGEWYLISSNCNMPHEKIVTMAFYDRPGVWLAHNDYERMGRYNCDEWKNVTHWMPLPEPPCAN